MNHKQTLKEIKKDPSYYYKSPQKVVRDVSFDEKEKKEILNQWEQDAKALLRAEGENMPAERAMKIDPAEQLQDIENAKRKLK